ncbi:MAG: hypothetical protein ABJF09_00600 [Qipengyuania citrea]|uniref:hypothetical protein n=1 Tax=Qipengyuania citrea TaxID=225971 RepID=UPI003262ECDF
MAGASAQAAPDLARANEGAEQDGRPPRLPQPSRVVPLGVYGKQLVFLDRLQQIVMEPPRGCSKGELALWFGDDYLIEYFPSYPKGWKPGDDDPEDFHQGKAQMALIDDCRAKGIFKPEGKVFGRGAHRPRHDEEAMVLHIGNRVLLANMPDARGRRSADIVQHPAGMVRIGGKETFYPADDGLPPPADKPATAAEAAEVRALFEKWSWAEPAAAPLLLFGWLGQAFICGWLEWRAHAWLPGPTASGKSSLQKIIRALLGEWVLSTADASEAAIRQILRNDTLPVSIDEAEPHDNPERVQAVMNLMKKASSGDRILRGGADHKGTEFTAQSCFLLSSVMHATLRGEDRNRIALLDMKKLPDNPEPLELELAKWRSTGRRLHRRMIGGIGRFDRTLGCYKRAIGAQGYEGRWQDTYGTLLACADLLLYDYAPDAGFDEAVETDEPGMRRVHEAVMAILPMMAKGRVEARTDTERVSRVLLSHALPGAHGSPPEPVGTWIERALTWVELDASTGGDSGPDFKARAKLKTYGLRVVQLVDDAERATGYRIEDARTGDDGWKHDFLAVAYPTNKGINEIFARGDWMGDGYLQSLRKLDGTKGPFKVRFGGRQPDNALLVPLAALSGDEG